MNKQQLQDKLHAELELAWAKFRAEQKLVWATLRALPDDYEGTWEEFNKAQG